MIGESAGDTNDTPIEVMWEAARVAIIAVGTDIPEMGAEWDVRTADNWTTDELLAALTEGHN